MGTRPLKRAQIILKPSEKIEILARRRPEFELGYAGDEAAQLE